MIEEQNPPDEDVAKIRDAIRTLFPDMEYAVLIIAHSRGTGAGFTVHTQMLGFSDEQIEAGSVGHLIDHVRAELQ